MPIPPYTSRDDEERRRYTTLLGIVGFDSSLFWTNYAGLSVCRGSIAGVGPLFDNLKVGDASTPSAGTELVSTGALDPGYYDWKLTVFRDDTTNWQGIYVYRSTGGAGQILIDKLVLPANASAQWGYWAQTSGTARVQDQKAIYAEIEANDAAAEYTGILHWQKRFELF